MFHGDIDVPTIAFTAQQDGFWRGWSALVGGTFGFETVDDSTDTTHDGATTHLTLPRFIAATGSGRVSFPIMLQAGGLLPLSLTLNVAAIQGGASHPRLHIGFHRGGVTGFHATMFDPTASYTVATRTFTTDPITGAAWTAEGLVGLEACIQSENVAGNNDVSLISGSVSYAPMTNRMLPIQRMR
jgi:hypothetical protein